MIAWHQYKNMHYVLFNSLWKKPQDFVYFQNKNEKVYGSGIKTRKKKKEIVISNNLIWLDGL